ncbi:MAG: ATP-binding cassette domain-containing protein [Pseudomonadota bacterium]
MIQLVSLSKRFVLHAQGAVELGVLDGLSLEGSRAANASALDGPSGIGKSTLLRTVYANYKADAGRSGCAMTARWSISPGRRRATCWRCAGARSAISASSCMSSRACATLKIVAEPLRARGVAPGRGRTTAPAAMLRRLGLPEALWRLAPATFSGGEQQRVNIARGFIAVIPFSCSTSRPRRSTPTIARGWSN